MFILDKPYVSEFLLDSARSMKIPLLDNGHMLTDTSGHGLRVLSDTDFLSSPEHKRH